MKAPPEIIRAALEHLAAAYRNYSTAELRWDYLCNITEDSRNVIRGELERRRVSMETFRTFGRGKVKS